MSCLLREYAVALLNVKTGNYYVEGLCNNGYRREKERHFGAGSGQPKAALYWQWLINNLTQPELRPPPPPIPCDLLEVGKTHLL